MTEPATRTRTFVFTDIEGSTQHLRELGREYHRALREHDRIIATATAAHSGEVFGSEGDAQHLVFDDPLAAVLATTQAQRNLESHHWPAGRRLRARMGVHSGEATRDDAGFMGIALHETARVSAAAHGGQVLISPATAELVRGRLPRDITLRDLGEHVLKDIEEPVRLHQLCIDGLEQDFPALRARTFAQTRLPDPVTSFVERDEVAAIVGLSEEARLLTLTGPGGTGKTRLAIAAAERIAHRYADGTWFVALDAVHEAQLVIPEVATVLGLSASSGSPLERLLDHLRDRSVLLVLDNLEQVIDAGTSIARVISECPAVTVVATSRIPLRVYGEQEFPVPALPLPTRGDTADAARLGTIASVQLFQERARAAKPAFVLDDDNAADVADIVARLDGLPLAIELAAARIRMLPPAALRRRLDDRLGTLTSGARDRPGRQRTLRGAIAWSHDLLDEPDRRLFARFGVFAGHAALSQIEVVVGPSDEIGHEIFDGLESLVEQSLLRPVETDEEEPRFAMLATIREYARERLDESGEADRIHRRHAESYLDLAEVAAPQLAGPKGSDWNDRLERDHDDLRTALDWMVANDEAELGLRMVVALWRFWQFRGHLHEADQRVHAVLAMPSSEGQPVALRSRAEAAAGGVAYWRSQPEAIHRHYQAALELARQTDDRALVAESLYNLGFAPFAGSVSAGHQQMAARASYFEEALAIYQELGDEAGVAHTSWSLAIQAAVRGEVALARDLAERSLDAARSIGDTYQIGWSLHTLGQSDVAVGDLDAAAAHIRESLGLWVEAGDMSGVTLLLIDAVVVARALGREACSWRLVGAEERLRLATGIDIGIEAIEFPDLDPRRVPETDEERQWFEEGQALPLEEAIDLARTTALTRDRTAD